MDTGQANRGSKRQSVATLCWGFVGLVLPILPSRGPSSLTSLLTTSRRVTTRPTRTRMYAGNWIGSGRPSRTKRAGTLPWRLSVSMRSFVACGLRLGTILDGTLAGRLLSPIGLTSPLSIACCGRWSERRSYWGWMGRASWHSRTPRAVTPRS